MIDFDAFNTIYGIKSVSAPQWTSLGQKVKSNLGLIRTNHQWITLVGEVMTPRLTKN
jgi:hypothetical protein